MKLSEEFRREMTLCHESAVPVWERAAEMAEREEQSHVDLVERLRGFVAELRKGGYAYTNQAFATELAALLPPEGETS